MIAALDDLAVLQHHDRVGVAHGGEAMGNDKGGAILHQGVHALLDMALGSGVDRGGGLVQHQDRCLAQGGPGDVQQLALALGQVCAVAFDHRVVAVGQAADEAVGAGGLRGGYDLFIGGVQPAIADVLHHRAGEQVGVLEHHGDVPTQIALGHVHDVNAVDGDPAGINVVEPVQQVGDGGLARAGGAHEGDLLARLGIQADVLQHRLFRHIAEADVVQDHVALQLLRHCDPALVQRLGLLVHHCEHAFRASQGGKDRGHLLGDLVDRAGELAGIVDEYGQSAHVEAAQGAGWYCP